MVYEYEKGIINQSVFTAKASCDLSIIDYKEKSESVRANIDYLTSLLIPNKMDRGNLWFPAILVSTNWNKNDDIFTPDEVAKSYISAKMKPVNWMHNIGEVAEKNEVIGVINECLPVDDNFSILPDNSLSTENHYHIAIGNLVWSEYFPTYAADIVTGTVSGKLFVSMESSFTNFGYGIRVQGSNEILFLDRNEKTSQLTKFLRAYGGPGFVKINNKEYQIGRWIKDITFTSVGCVNKPANANSVIFNDVIIAAEKTDINKINEEITTAIENGVLILKEENIIMADDKSTNVDFTELNKTIASLNEEVETNKNKITELSEALTLKDKSLNETNAALNVTKAGLDELNKILVTVKAERDAFEAKIKEAESKALIQARTNELAGLGVNLPNDQHAMLAGMSAESFATMLTIAKIAYDAKAAVNTETDIKKTEESVNEVDTKVETAEEVLAKASAAEKVNENQKLMDAIEQLRKNRSAKNK